MPSVDLFEQQDPAYVGSGLPNGIPVVTVGAGVTGPWRAYAGRGGLTIGIDRFGASAPAGDIYPHFGITVEAVTEAARKALTR